MKRLVVFTAIIAAAAVTPCTADTIGLFRGSVQVTPGGLDNEVLWVIFAPQPEPPYLPRIIPDSGRMVAESPGPFVSALVGVAIEGAVGLDWSLNGTAMIPLSSHGGTSLHLSAQIGGVPGLAAHFTPVSPAMMPPVVAPQGMSWLWAQITFDCQPGAACVQYDNGVDLNQIVLSVNDATGALVPMESVPEPASLFALGTGLVGLHAWRRRRG